MYFALLAMFIPFLPVYFDDQGLNPAQIGVIIGTGGFITIIAQPVWGMISDRMRTIRKVLLILLVFSAVTGYLLYNTGSYPLLVAFAMVTYFFLMPIDPLTESLNFRIAESSGINYGSIRTFGALGYAVMSLLTGVMMTHYGAHSLAILFAVISVLGFITMLFIPDAPVSSTPVKLGTLKEFIRNKETLWFLLLVFISSVPARMNDTFLGVYIRELGGSATLVGVTWFLAAGSEIVVFAFSYWWLRQGKELIMISVAGAFYFLRFFLSAFITDPQVLAYLQILQLLTFPVFYTAAIQYLYRIVPVEWRATGQTLLALLFFGVSGIIASYIGGALYANLGGQTLFFIISAMSFLGMLLGLSLYFKYGRTRKSEKEMEQA
ncbi:major facilitator superfamily domain-containing protein 6 [Paenibacillus pini]